jgi:5-methyltetrahydropteroyltriglutamate--homocysteine methyltransferase
MIPSEPIGSIPRPLELVEAIARCGADDPSLEPLYQAAIKDTVRRFEATGSPVLSDGEQRKYHNFWTYCVEGSADTAPDGFRIPFAAGHARRMPRLTRGPFRYRRSAHTYLQELRAHTSLPVKQAVISPSALSLMYPAAGIPGYSREQFIDDLLAEHEREVRSCLELGAQSVQIDFTEARLALKLDPSGALLGNFVALNNLALARFGADERRRIGVHTCPGADRDSTHSADIPYAALLPALFQLEVGRFYIALAGEKEPESVLRIIRRCMRPGQLIFVGVTSPIDPQIDSPQDVCGRVLDAARHIPIEQLGTTDDCGFAPFSDDVSTSRDTAFAKIAARIEGTRLAEQALRGGC